jgi:hypothetical protein
MTSVYYHPGYAAPIGMHVMPIGKSLRSHRRCAQSRACGSWSPRRSVKPTCSTCTRPSTWRRFAAGADDSRALRESMWVKPTTALQEEES